jgi:hypothetical protein
LYWTCSNAGDAGGTGAGGTGAVGTGGNGMAGNGSGGRGSGGSTTSAGGQHVSDNCGTAYCGAGQYCCNSVMSLCAPNGSGCIQ